MGDWFQTIADVDATAEQAGDLAALVLGHLVEQGIVRAEETDCALGAGHAPGPHHRLATTKPDPRLLEPGTNGLRVLTGRRVFYSMDWQRVHCPHCGALVADGPDAGWDRLSQAVSDWAAEATDGTRDCPACDRPTGLNDWTWDPPWAFGHLGFEFWNWPPLSPAFTSTVAGLLGHRVALPRGKL